MHGLFSYLEDRPGGADPLFHELSHGESFLAMLASGRFADAGFFVLDEPEAGLSFESLLVLVGLLAELAADPRAQVLLATHSPVLAAIPGATCCSSTRTDSPRPPGRTWRWWTTTAVSWVRLCSSCGTCWFTSGKTACPACGGVMSEADAFRAS